MKKKRFIISIPLDANIPFYSFISFKYKIIRFIIPTFNNNYISNVFWYIADEFDFLIDILEYTNASNKLYLKRLLYPLSYKTVYDYSRKDKFKLTINYHSSKSFKYINKILDF